MAYTLEETEKMASALRALPPPDRSKRRLTKQDVVKQLAREIEGLQARGYTIEQIAESLQGVGLEITTPTLKNYLQRNKVRSEKQAPKKQSRSGPPEATSGRKRPTAAAAVTEPKGSAPTASNADAAVNRSGKDAFLVKDKDSY